MNRSRLSWIFSVLALCALAAGCGGPTDGAGAVTADAGNSPDAGTEEPVEVITVKASYITRRPMSELYSTSANLRADKQATITARTTGVVEKLLVEEGDLVTEGAVVAVLEDDEQRIEQQRTAIARDTRARELTRAINLHGQGLMSDEEYETVSREAEEARHAADLAELKLSRTRIRAPFSGRILRRHLDVGANVADRSQVYDIADLDPLYADVNVPEKHVARLAPGQSVNLSSDTGKIEVEAVIERIAPVVDSDTGTVKVTLAVSRNTGMRPGTFTRVDFVVETRRDSLVVPRSALVADGRRWYMFRLAAGGEKVERLEVVPGFEDRDLVEVLEVLGHETVLEPGDRVVSVGASALSDGSHVRVEEEQEGEDGVSS